MPKRLPQYKPSHHLYNAECESALDEIKQALEGIRVDYHPRAFGAALMAYLMGFVVDWRNISPGGAMQQIESWAKTWKDRV